MPYKTLEKQESESVHRAVSSRIQSAPCAPQNAMPDLTNDERRRIQTAIQRAHEIGFTPEPASDVAAKLKAARNAAASSALENNPLTSFELELQEQLTRRRVPAEVAIAVFREDMLANPLTATGAV